MTAYDPNVHRDVIAADGETSRKFFPVNKLLIVMAAAGLIRLAAQDAEPSDTTKIWLDISNPEAGNGAVKVYVSGSWQEMTPERFISAIENITAAQVTSDAFDDVAATNVQAALEELRTLMVSADSPVFTGNPRAPTPSPGDNDTSIATTAFVAAGFQPLDSDLTAIAALTTTSFGRAFLALADAAATRTAIGLVIGTDVQAFDADLAAWAGVNPSSYSTTSQIAAAYQPLDSDLTAIAALTTTSFGRAVLALADAAALRTAAGLVIGTDVQAFDAELAALAGLTSAANKVPYFTGSGTAALEDFTAAGRAMVAAANAAAQTALLSNAVGDSGSGGTKGLVPAPVTGDATKFLRGDMTFQTIPGGGDALTSNPLSQFAATTSAQLRSVLSDETGTGAAVFADSPTLVTPALGTPSGGDLQNCTTATTSAKGVAEHATDGEAQAKSDTARTLTPSNLAALGASTTFAGLVELATGAETTTGTDATRAVTPDGLAGSDFGKRVVSILAFTDDENVTTGDGAGDVFWRVPSTHNGMNLVAVAACVQTAGTTGTTDIQIRRVRSGTPADMLSTKLTIDSTETDTLTAAAAAVINTSNDDVATGDRIFVDVDAVSTTKPLGLLVELIFQLP